MNKQRERERERECVCARGKKQREVGQRKRKEKTELSLYKRILPPICRPRHRKHTLMIRRVCFRCKHAGKTRKNQKEEKIDGGEGPTKIRQVELMIKAGRRLDADSCFWAVTKKKQKTGRLTKRQCYQTLARCLELTSAPLPALCA